MADPTPSKDEFSTIIGADAQFKGDLTTEGYADRFTDALIAEFRPGAMKKLSVNCQLQLSQSLLNTVVDRLMFADERIAHA